MDLIGLGKALHSPLWAWPFHYHMSNNERWLNIHMTSENFLSATLQGKHFWKTQWSNGLFPRWLSRKEPASQCRRCRRPGFNPWVGKIPWRSNWQPISVFLPEKFDRQRVLGATIHRAAKSWTRMSHWICTLSCKHCCYLCLTNGEASFLLFSHQILSDSLWPHGLSTPWKSLSQNTGVGSVSLLQGIFLTPHIL